MKSLQKRRSTALILAVVWLAVCLVLTLAMGQTKATEDYEIKLLAAHIAEYPLISYIARLDINYNIRLLSISCKGISILCLLSTIRLKGKVTFLIICTPPAGGKI